MAIFVGFAVHAGELDDLVALENEGAPEVSVRGRWLLEGIARQGIDEGELKSAYEAYVSAQRAIAVRVFTKILSATRGSDARLYREKQRALDLLVRRDSAEEFRAVARFVSFERLGDGTSVSAARAWSQARTFDFLHGLLDDPERLGQLDLFKAFLTPQYCSDFASQELLVHAASAPFEVLAPLLLAVLERRPSFGDEDVPLLVALAQSPQAALRAFFLSRYVNGEGSAFDKHSQPAMTAVAAGAFLSADAAVRRGAIRFAATILATRPGQHDAIAAAALKSGNAEVLTSLWPLVVPRHTWETAAASLATPFARTLRHDSAVPAGLRRLILSAVPDSRTWGDCLVSVLTAGIVHR